MMLLVGDDAIAGRSHVAHNELAALARGLTSELAAVESHRLDIPKEKALLSRVGGRCERDGTTLEFDPFSPHRHRCPTCGMIHAGELHDRFWVFWYQLWLAERAVHGALLGRLLCQEKALALSTAILDRYVDQYLLYPNKDNVLGPTRVFFSTYLESIWLLNLCIALDLLEGSPGLESLAARVRDRIIEPSAALIASYDEGASNRQVWNDAALLAAGRLLERPAAAERAVFGNSGVLFHLEHGLLADGTWYEGENYHLFAHRGLWYCVTMAEYAGLELPAAAVARFEEGFATPFLTSLPDMTLPSRRDSQYAISLRQPRFAELCELGLARQSGDGDPRLRAMLYRLYEDDYPRREIGRANSTADVERNLPGTKLSRGDLGWRSLLCARPKLPPLAPASLGTVLLEAQGIAVFRRAAERVYVALDYGSSGGGHGHPDRLNVLLSDGDTRWLDDMGTGSYVDPSLHWYRTTLAHNAPLFNGCEQQRVDGVLLAFEERDGVGWISAGAKELYPGVAVIRTLVVMQDYALDELVWRAPEPVVVDLPIHLDAISIEARREITTADVPLEDTLGVISVLSARWLRPRALARLLARNDDTTLHGFVRASAASLLYHVTGPGAPGQPEHPFLVMRASAAHHSGWIRSVWTWENAVESMSVDDQGDIVTVERRDGSRDEHRHALGSWRIARVAGELTRSLVLTASQAAPKKAPGSRPAPAPPLGVLREGEPLIFDLGESVYRRSELSWEEADRPTARVGIMRMPNHLVIDVIMRKSGALTFVPAGATNPYDNESPDINGDGVQVYLADPTGASAWMLVPELDAAREGRVRARLIDGWTAPRTIRAVWRRLEDGYALRVRIRFAPVPAGESEIAIGVVVNEKPDGRERRRGQLVLGGNAGEFVYLRGDREERARLPRFAVAD